MLLRASSFRRAGLQNTTCTISCPYALSWSVTHPSHPSSHASIPTPTLQYYAELGMPAQARLLAEQAEAAGGGGAGVLGSLRGAVGGTVGSLVSRMQGERG